jgi:uncharacterized protein YndB with AHSA1/START domain
MTMPDGREIEFDGVYHEIVRPFRLVLTWRRTFSGDETLLSLRFEPDGDGTMMYLEQSGFAAEHMSEGYHSGWSGEGGSFDKLADVLADTPQAREPDKKRSDKNAN